MEQRGFFNVLQPVPGVVHFPKSGIREVNSIQNTLLACTLGHIDEYALAHYFANLLMDDFIGLYVKAAADRKLKVYDNGNIIVPDDEIEPTCISDVDDERLRVQLWKMKELLETQVKKERFWEIDEEFLLEIGTCIGELMFAKLKVMSEQA